ncbi:MAG TPA: HAD hydrolase family protein [Candidatus Sumerlaeota bacterium]|nr:HAD hydrolase family protein [Candidatus Sumerlaeota bacterium]
MPVRWIIADVDGCLSPEDSVAWDLPPFLRLVETVRRANAGESDIAPLTLCTGRPQPYVEVLMKLFDVRAPAIVENGAVFYTLPDNTSRYGPGVTEDKLLGLRAVRAYIETDLLARFPEAVLQFGKEAQLSLFSRRTEQFAEMQRRIEAFVAERGGPDLLINASHFYLNISLRGVNKGNALRALMGELGVGHDDLAGIGDTVGDLPLREVVAFFACPANSQDEIKRVADYVSPFPFAEGVLDILRRPELRRR